MSKTSKINLIDLAGSERASTALNDEVINSKETYEIRLKVKYVALTTASLVDNGCLGVIQRLPPPKSAPRPYAPLLWLAVPINAAMSSYKRPST